MEEVPANLKNAAIVQIISGILNIFFSAWIAWFGIGTFCSLLTILLGGIGGVCGMAGCLLVPFGAVEVLSGALALSNPKQFGKFVPIVGFLELGTILVGGLLSAIAGGVVVAMTRDASVKAYLES